MNLPKLKYIIFLGTTRQNRLGLRVARYVVNKVKERGHEAILIDPVEHKFEMLKQPIHFYKNKNEIPENLSNMNTQIKEADGIIVVSAEYNHSIPPALSNTMDHFPGSSFAWKPSGICTYSPGIFGGIRAAMQLRAFLGELGCISVSNIMAIPKVHEVMDEDGNQKDGQFDMGRASTKMLDQLDWWAQSAKKQKECSGTPQ